MAVVVFSILLSFSVSAVADISGSEIKTPMCASPRLTKALEYIGWHEKNLNYNLMARASALEDAQGIQRFANFAALTSSFIFLVSLFALVSALVLRLSKVRTLSFGLAIGAFVISAEILLGTKLSLDTLIRDFQVEANRDELDRDFGPVGNPSRLRDVVNSLTKEQNRVPRVFHERAAFLPKEGRWWSLGWDEVAFVNFQSEAYRAAIRKGELNLKALSSIRGELEKRCRDGGIKI